MTDCKEPGCLYSGQWGGYCYYHSKVADKLLERLEMRVNKKDKD